MRRWLRVYGAFLRAGIAHTLAYRAMLVIWILSGILPLIMMVVWITVAGQQADGAIAGFDRQSFISYYLAVVVIRRLSGAWVIWDIDEDVRLGLLSARLLRPVDPLHHYFSMPLSEKPLEFLLIFPPVAVAAVWLGASYDLSPLNLATVAVAIFGAICIEFFAQMVIGMLAFWMTQMLTVVQVWFYLRSFFSGWIVPLALFPEPVQEVLTYLPFRYMLSFQIEMLLGQLSPREIVLGFAFQLAWIGGLAAVYRLLWQRGLRRYSAVGA